MSITLPSPARFLKQKAANWPLVRGTEHTLLKSYKLRGKKLQAIYYHGQIIAALIKQFRPFLFFFFKLLFHFLKQLRVICEELK